MQIKCKRFNCQVCGKVSTIQLFYRTNGELAYARARHYIGRVNGKPQFQYHQQSLMYLKQNMGQDIGQSNQSNLGIIYQNKAKFANNRLPVELLYMAFNPSPAPLPLSCVFKWFLC
jgi:hypothetical protein